jgi:phosphatidylserine decarboxylase
MTGFPIVKEGFVYIGSLLAVTFVAAWTIGIYWAVLPAIITIFLTFFFRNPPRNIPVDPDLILSPADGRVMGITEVQEDEFLHAQGIKVSIFLSVFDVHVNRSPAEGVVKFQQYVCGRFRPAYKAIAAWENERHAIGIETPRIKILVTQIAGILARRIVSWVTLGSELRQGDLYGMIKFGSCTEIIMPKNVEILVKKGQHVTGGITVIGRVLT